MRPYLRKKFFFSKLADFWYLGVFGHEKSIGTSPEFQKNFYDPLPGYPMLKNQFFQLFYFSSKLADFWYSGVFGHEKSIGASPEFQTNFHDPPVVKTCNVFSKKCYMFSPTKGSWKFFFEPGTCANRFLVPENPCIEQVVTSVTTTGLTCYVSNQTTNLFGKLLDNHQMKQ